MATTAHGGWSIRLPADGRKIYVVRFRHAGKRIVRSTGCADPGEASREGAKIYADTISGRRTARSVSTDLDVAVAAFLVDFGMTSSPRWTAIVELYFMVHLLPFFESFDRFTPSAYVDYGRARLQKVSRPTVRKELSALRRFVAWCVEHDLMLPPVPALPKHGTPGVRAKNARKRKATIIEPGDAKRLLLAMPERSRRTGEWTRPLFTVLYETGLRSTTVLRLETPLHYTRGQGHLFITREIDKEGYERRLPLTPAARTALDRACPACPGRIFTAKRSSLRHSFEAAKKIAGLEDLDASPYDLRHTRLTRLANTANVPLAGVSYLAGHKHLSTTSLYVQASEGAAREALLVMAATVPRRRAVPRQKGGPGARSGARRAEKRGAKEGT